MIAPQLLKMAEGKVASFNIPSLINAGFLPLKGDYFPSIYYPPITMYPSSNCEEMFRGLDYKPEDPMCLYIHIPFCPTHCVFCHWTTSRGDSIQSMEHYVNMLAKEIDLWKEHLGVENVTPHSILIGGGTPTMLPPAQLELFLASLHSKFELKKDLQISCEAEPSTLLGPKGWERLKILKSYGINRISMGVQSFNNKILKNMGRAHTAEDVRQAIQSIKNSGFESLSIDLIYGLPGQTTETWVHTLHEAFSVDVDSCQIYRLRIVPHGDKKGKIKDKFDSAPQQFAGTEMIYIWKALGGIMAAQNGFFEDSRRVFSRNPKHSSEYLKDHTDRLLNVWGFGVSSWSNVRGRAFLNTGSGYGHYYSYIENKKLPINRGKVRTADDQKRWALVLPLKHKGLSKKYFEEKTGQTAHEAFGAKINRLKKFDLIEEDEGKIMLTEKGRFFADEVAIQFYHPDFIPFPRAAYAQGELNPYIE